MCELESFLNSCQARFFPPLSLSLALQALRAHGKTRSDMDRALPLLPSPAVFADQDTPALAGGDRTSLRDVGPSCASATSKEIKAACDTK